MSVAVSAPSSAASFSALSVRCRSASGSRASRGVSTYTASQSAFRLAARRAAARTSVGASAPGPTHTSRRSRACQMRWIERSARYSRICASTRSAVRRSASSRSAIRLPLRKKLRTARSACCAM
ncbi:putative osmosensitive K+ channel signal transduction histidine kinase [Burkholderia pseudomallei]|nr:putative osmosensitive K+ channel signal transduction histidine kinase [Burkholderia pseudomallei]